MIIYKLVIVILMLVIIYILLLVGSYMQQYQKEIDYVYKKINAVKNIENKFYDIFQKCKSTIKNFFLRILYYPFGK